MGMFCLCSEFYVYKYSGEPIWTSAELNNITVAMTSLPGSDAPIKNITPTYFLRYNGSMTIQERVDWLLNQIDKEKKPHFMSLYFENVDSMGHFEGPDSIKVGEELKKVDDTLGILLKELEKRKFREMINIILLSDHGMATVRSENVVHLDDYVENFSQKVDVYNINSNGTHDIMALVHPKNRDDILEIYNSLKNSSNMDVYLKHEIPQRFHFKNNRRVPEILCVAKEGFTISLREYNKPGPSGGKHGYDPTLHSMRAFFVANGPAFKKGYKFDMIRSVDLYALMCKILGIPEAPNNGTLDNVSHMLL